MADGNGTGESEKREEFLEMKQGDLFQIHYEQDQVEVDPHFDPAQNTVWLTQAQMADLFEVGRPTISKHLRNIFDDNELEENLVCSILELNASTEKQNSTKHYNLDAILAVGYRVSSKKATKFRQWATKILRHYLDQGYALNESRLRSDDNALSELAKKVRALRADEKNIYKGVRDVFAFGSSDYVPNSKEARAFFARLQDKFAVAVTGKTTAEILLDRASHKRTNSGIQSFAGNRPKSSEVVIGKNYLDRGELYQLHILCEQFLLFTESKALRGQALPMKEMSKKFDDLLEVQGHEIFRNYGDKFLPNKAKAHAEREYRRWLAISDEEKKSLSP